MLSYRNSEHYDHIFGPWARQQDKLKDHTQIGTETLIRVKRNEIASI